MRFKIPCLLCFAFSVTIIHAQEVNQNIVITKRYLNLPVKNSQTRQQMIFKENGKSIRSFAIRLSNEKPDYWVSSDMSEFKGKTVNVSYPAAVSGFKEIYQSDELAGSDSVYREANRPQFHFTPKIGWNNDPNGLVYYKGEYHLFYQHNPYEVNWENMHWGHAVSKDLVHWTELAEALYPDSIGAMFSGSAVVDVNNNSGFQKGNEKTLVAAYTAHQDGTEVQCIAYSNDAGRTWNKYAGNPVINSKAKWNSGNTRDPKVFWHEESKRWIMVLFERDGHSIYNSTDLKKWEYKSHLGGFWECPELFQLPVDGDKNKKKWVMYGASGTYMIGSFDGQSFKPETDKLKYYEGNMYAPQTYNDIPKADGRRIQIGWGTIAHQGTPFGQMMLFPSQLTLRTAKNGIRMFSEPVSEINSLHKKDYQWKDLTASQANENLKSVKGDLFHIKMKVRITDGTSFDFRKNGNSIVRYDMNHNKLNGAFYEGSDIENMTMTIEVLLDRTSMEIFADQGRYSIIGPIGIPKNDNGFEFKGQIKILSLELHELRSIWNGD